MLLEPEMVVETVWTDTEARGPAARVFVTAAARGMGALVLNLLLPERQLLLMLAVRDGAASGSLVCEPLATLPALDAVGLSALKHRAARRLGHTPLPGSHEPEDTDADLDTELSVLAEVEPGAVATAASYPGEALVLSPDRRLALYAQTERLAGVLVLMSAGGAPPRDMTPRVTALQDAVHNRFTVCLDDPDMPAARFALPLAPDSAPLAACLAALAAVDGCDASRDTHLQLLRTYLPLSTSSSAWDAFCTACLELAGQTASVPAALAEPEPSDADWQFLVDTNAFADGLDLHALVPASSARAAPPAPANPPGAHAACLLLTSVTAWG